MSKHISDSTYLSIISILLGFLTVYEYYSESYTRMVISGVCTILMILSLIREVTNQK